MMLNKKPRILIDEYISRDGRKFFLSDERWQLNKNSILSVSWTSQLEQTIRDSYLRVLARFAEEYAPATTKALNDECRVYIKKAGDDGFYVDSLISFRSTLLKDQECRLASVRMLIRNWYDWGYSGIDEEVMDLLDSWRLKGFEKGKAVKRLDPKEGPYSEIEMTTLLEGMLNAYIDGSINLYEYSIAAILAFTGRRPIQITNLKLCDIVSSKKCDVDEYSINFPRAKQHFTKWRSEFNSFPITEELWLLLNLQKNRVINYVSEILGYTPADEAVSLLPLFPDFDSFERGTDKNILLDNLASDYYHSISGVCIDALHRISKKLNIYSERTGERLNLATRRFRYTLGSNIARDGKGELIIAEALDHSDTQNVGVYVRNLPDVVERIDKAVALQLAPLAQAFQGVLVDSEDEAVRGNDISSRVGNGEVNVGSCGSYGFCGAMAPIACYTCKHFQPWIDGPHEIILDELLDKRDEVFCNTNDIKIASSNDRLILAVAQVIRRCKAKNAEQLMLEASDG